MSNLLRRCHECSQPLGAKDRFCPRCGAKQPREPKAVSGEPRRSGSSRWFGFRQEIGGS